MNHSYPNIKQCFGLFGLSIGTQLFAAIVCSGFQDGLYLLTTQLVSNLLILAIALKFKHGQVAFQHLVLNNQKFNLLILPILVVFNIAFIAAMEPVTSLIPMPETFKRLFAEMLHKDVSTYIGLAILAPLGEELLFRKIMLTGLVNHFGQRKGILWSAFFFAFFHLNPWQGISAFFIGIFLAWIYLNTRNIWIPIFLHFINNSISFGFFYFTDDAFEDFPNFLGEYQWLIFMVISSIVMYLCIQFLQRLFIPISSCSDAHEEIEPIEPSET